VEILPAATSTACLTPSTASHNVSIPNTGGVTGTIAVAAFASAGTSCDVTFTIASGSDVVDPSATADAGLRAATERRAAASSPQPQPIFSIGITDAFTSNVGVAGVTLNTPAALNFPDGTYYAVVAGGLLGGQTLTFTAHNGVLTLSPTPEPFVVVPGSTATLYLFNKGVIPPENFAPTPTPSPTPTLAPGASPSPTASPTPSPTPTASPTPTPAPSPTAPSDIVASSLSISPSACFTFPLNGTTQDFSATLVTNAPPGTVTFYYYWSNNMLDVYTLNVPNPVTSINGFTPPRNVTVSTGTTVSVTAPNGNPTNTGQVGGTGILTVTAWYAVPSITGYVQQVTDANGTPVSATASWVWGESNCP